MRPKFLRKIFLFENFFIRINYFEKKLSEKFNSKYYVAFLPTECFNLIGRRKYAWSPTVGLLACFPGQSDCSIPVAKGHVIFRIKFFGQFVFEIIYSDKKIFEQKNIFRRNLGLTKKINKFLFEIKKKVKFRE